MGLTGRFVQASLSFHLPMNGNPTAPEERSNAQFTEDRSFSAGRRHEGSRDVGMHVRLNYQEMQTC
jgi:hypothetical protein